MERYSLIIVSDETSPIRRFEVAKTSVRRLVYALATAALLLVVGLVDYVRVRIDQVELERLRVETAEQRAKIESFDSTVAEVKSTLDRVRDFERKVRTIANLPGSAAAGGADVVEVGPEDSGDLAALDDLSGQGEGEPVHTSEPLPAGARERRPLGLARRRERHLRRRGHARIERALQQTRLPAARGRRRNAARPILPQAHGSGRDGGALG